jgi:hypothetical protein
MHVADDHGLDRGRVDADRLEAVADRLDQLALALLPIAASKPVSRTIGPALTDDRPDVEIERLQHVVRIAADEILRRLAIMVPVADRVDLVDVVAHVRSPLLTQSFPGASEAREPGIHTHRRWLWIPGQRLALSRNDERGLLMS